MVCKSMTSYYNVICVRLKHFAVSARIVLHNTWMLTESDYIKHHKIPQRNNSTELTTKYVENNLILLSNGLQSCNTETSKVVPIDILIVASY